MLNWTQILPSTFFLQGETEGAVSSARRPTLISPTPFVTQREIVVTASVLFNRTVGWTS
jgi:hypothetical protein